MWKCEISYFWLQWNNTRYSAVHCKSFSKWVLSVQNWKRVSRQLTWHVVAKVIRSSWRQAGIQAVLFSNELRCFISFSAWTQLRIDSSERYSKLYYVCWHLSHDMSVRNGVDTLFIKLTWLCNRIFAFRRVGIFRNQIIAKRPTKKHACHLQ